MNNIRSFIPIFLSIVEMILNSLSDKLDFTTEGITKMKLVVYLQAIFLDSNQRRMIDYH